VSAFAAFFSGQPNRRRVIHGVLITLDPNLTLTRTQYPATVSNRENKNRVVMRDLQPLATHDRSLVKRVGQRFESARRLSIFPANPVKTQSLQVGDGGFVSSTSAVDYPEAPSLASVCCKWLQGIAGGVGGSSGMERLTDAPGFRLVRHCPKSSARVPRKKKKNSAKSVVAISEPHHLAAAEHLEGCQPCLSRRRTSPRTERGNVARCCDLLR
jgi:hypothetical protein